MQQDALRNEVKLAVVLMQTNWQAAFQSGGEGPADFWRAAEEEVAHDLARVCQEADKRGYLPPGLPSGECLVDRIYINK